MWTGFSEWLNNTPIVVPGVIVLLLMAAGALGGAFLRRRNDSADASRGVTVPDGHEAYIVSAVLALLGLMMGFTFSLAVDRYEARRALVLEESNAIGTAYLRTQLLQEPHRERLSGLLVAYVDNRLDLAEAKPGDDIRPLLSTNDRLIVDLWAATASAFETIKGMDFSSAYLDSMNLVIDLDAARRAAHVVRVPAEVFLILFFYMIVTAAVLGYVLVGPRGRASGAVMLVLATVVLMLVIDIDRPGRGGVTESQRPMTLLRDFMRDQPPATFDRWRIADANRPPPA